MSRELEEKLATVISTIDLVALDGLTNSEKLLALSNMILTIGLKYFPSELSADRLSVASNGKSIAYQLMKYPDNVGLNIAVKAHHLIALSQSVKGLE